MNVLGLPLDIAVKRLRPLGKRIEKIEISSRKGSAGNDKRVVKAEELDSVIRITWARFQTDAEFHSEGAE